MLTTSTSFTSSLSSRNNGLSPNQDSQLATSIKEGCCTPADEERLSTLLASPEGKTFFENATVQRILLEGVLDGKITDQRIVDRLKDCAVCLTQDAQIDLIRSRTGMITHLSPERCAEIGFVLRFFCAEQQVELRELNTQLRLPEESVDVVQTTTSTGRSISSDPQQKKQESHAFETIANSIAGTADNLTVTELNNQQLAEAILYPNNTSQIEKDQIEQQFKMMLASEKKRATFFNDSAVQVMIVKALRDGRAINSDMLHGLQDCTPNLPDSNQQQLARKIRMSKNNIPQGVLLVVAKNLTIFTDPQAQQHIAVAIFYGRLGTTQAVLLAIAKNLTIFTDPTAQQNIACAIFLGKITTDQAASVECAEHLKNFLQKIAPQTQQNIAFKIQQGIQLGADLNLIAGVAKNLTIFTDPQAQRTIAWAICNGKFSNGNTPSLVAKNLHIFTDPQAQEYFRTANDKRKFDNNPTLRNAVVRLLQFRSTPLNKNDTAPKVTPQNNTTKTEIESTIESTIGEESFGNDSNVVLAVAQKTTPTRESISSDQQQTKQESHAFETIAHSIARTEDNSTVTELNNQQLAEAILYPKNTSSIEKVRIEQQFKMMLDSKKKRATFFNDSAVQVMIVEALCDGRAINSDMLYGLRDCTPNLPYSNQRQLAWAIRRGKDYIDQNVLSAVAQNLKIFADPRAQQHIAVAICNGKFSDLNTQSKVAKILPIFTDLQAREYLGEGKFVHDPKVTESTIELTIGKSGFGIDSDVVLAVAQEMGIVKDKALQLKIAEHIRNYKFGTTTNVFRAVAKNLTIFKDVEAQQSIAKAIEEGRFGTNPNVLETVAQNLHIFTDPQAQREIAWAIRNGRFGNDPAVLLAVAQNLTIFTDLEAQRKIALAIREGKFGANPAVLRIVNEILGGHFQNDEEVVLAVAQNLNIFTDPVAQQSIAMAISYRKFGANPAVLLAIAQHLSIFTDPEAQRTIAWAISNGTFGTDPTVLQAVAQHLNIFTDPQAQGDIARAISNDTFGTDPTVLQAVAQHLNIFTDPQAQRKIARAIRDGKFGTDPAVLLAVAQNLSIFTDPVARYFIVAANCANKFGTDTEVLQAVAQNLNIFTDPQAQQDIAKAINNRTFDTDPFLFEAVADNLVIFTDLEVQREIAWAIRDGRFGTGPYVLKAVAQNLTIFTDLEAQRMIAQAISNGRFGTDLAVFKAILKAVPQLLDTPTIIQLVSGYSLSAAEKIEVLRERKFSLDLSPTTLGIPEEDLPKLFGAKAYLGSEIKTLLRTHFPDATADGIDSVCEDNVEYAIQIHHQRLILYPLTSHQDKADFIGWMGPELNDDYIDYVTNIKIYDFSKLDNGKPTVQNWFSRDTFFTTLPAYLQQAIQDYWKLWELN